MTSHAQEIMIKEIKSLREELLFCTDKITHLNEKTESLLHMLLSASMMSSGQTDTIKTGNVFKAIVGEVSNEMDGEKREFVENDGNTTTNRKRKISPQRSETQQVGDAIIHIAD
jgi:hypothetical protein